MMQIKLYNTLFNVIFWLGYMTSLPTYSRKLLQSATQEIFFCHMLSEKYTEKCYSEVQF